MWKLCDREAVDMPFNEVAICIKLGLSVCLFFGHLWIERHQVLNNLACNKI